MTSFDAYVVELRELSAQLLRENIIDDPELDRMLDRLEFLREQIDLARKEVEGSRLAATGLIQLIQEELDDERSP